VAATLLAFVPAATSCFGGFALTRKVYRWNQQVDNDKWIRWLAFLALNLIPVYGFSMLFDVIFANSVEFWTGGNPIAAVPGTTRVVRGPGGEEARATWRADGAIDLEVREPGGRVHALTFVPEAEGVAALDAEGRVVARVQDVDGRPVLLRP
jgi:hypothetical protein